MRDEKQAQEIAVQMRLGHFDILHPEEEQTCVRVVHPKLGRPLLLHLNPEWAEDHEGLPWPSLVQAACEEWLEHTWACADMPRVEELLHALEDENSFIYASFYIAWATSEIRRLEERMRQDADVLASIREELRRCEAEVAREASDER